MMKQMGISQQEIDANKVIIESDEGNIIINNPSVIKINMQGQTNFQISGDVSEEENSQEKASEENLDEEEQDTTEEDIKTIIEKVGCLKEEAALALEKANGDLTEAILELS